MSNNSFSIDKAMTDPLMIEKKLRLIKRIKNRLESKKGNSVAKSNEDIDLLKNGRVIKYTPKQGSPKVMLKKKLTFEMMSENEKNLMDLYQPVKLRDDPGKFSRSFMSNRSGRYYFSFGELKSVDNCQLMSPSDLNNSSILMKTDVEPVYF